MARPAHSQKALALPLQWPHGSTILRRERVVIPPTRWQRLGRSTATAAGYLAILCLPITAWIVPPPSHFSEAADVPRPRRRIVQTVNVSTGPDSTHDLELDLGRQLFMQSCASCHGADAGGLPHQGLPLTTSTFLSERLDSEMLEFLRRGRQPTEAESKTKLLMPPRGSPPLRDRELQSVLAYLRNLQASQAPESDPVNDSAIAERPR